MLERIIEVPTLLPAFMYKWRMHWASLCFAHSPETLVSTEKFRYQACPSLRLLSLTMSLFLLMSFLQL